MHVIVVSGLLPNKIEEIPGFVEAREALEADPNADVKMMINCPGGNEIVLRQMLNFQAKYPIPVAAAGQCCSAAFYFLAAGKKGERYVHPDCQLVTHLGLVSTRLKEEEKEKGVIILSAADVRFLARKIDDIEAFSLEFWRKAIEGNDVVPDHLLLMVYAPEIDCEYTAEEAVKIKVADRMDQPSWMAEACKIADNQAMRMKKVETSLLDQLQSLLPSVE